MAVKLRMTRLGRRHRPFFRINAVEGRMPRDGKILEKLGHYDPLEKDPAKQIVIDLERVRYWLDNGAVPSDAVSEILLRQGVKHKYAEEKAAKRARAKAIARAKGKPFTEADRVAAQKQARADEEKAKSKAEAKAIAQGEEKPEPEPQTEPQAKPAAEAEAEPKANVKEAEEKSEPQGRPDTEEESQAASSEETDKSDEN